ncbi:hypothetical protein AOX55_00003087 [Sinorhizobium fredii CCBAU 25509]|nr:hypothetical protein SF83666_c28770 [Sinorhizobium fredii CCBAU 83666]AWM26328.1 hypothetical protein AOX55_00003087 [Sinorhizobium fredii CCBAU 25509]
MQAIVLSGWRQFRQGWRASGRCAAFPYPPPAPPGERFHACRGAFRARQRPPGHCRPI